MVYSLKGLISPWNSFVNSRFLLVSASLTVYFLLGKMCKRTIFRGSVVRFRGNLKRILNACLFCPRDFFVSTFFTHLKKDVSLKVPKQQTLSPLVLGKNM